MSKTFALTAAIALVGITTTFANTSFRWNPGAGSLKDSSNNNLPTGQTVLTFISTDTTVDALVSAGLLTLQDNYGPDDVFYKAMATSGGAPGAGRYITDYMSEAGDTYVGKYVYAIVLNMPFASFTSIAAVPKDGSIEAGVSTIGKVVGVNTAIIKLDTPQPGTPQSFDGGNVITNLDVVPEPTGAVLLLIGSAAILIRRRRMHHG